MKASLLNKAIDDELAYELHEPFQVKIPYSKSDAYGCLCRLTNELEKMLGHRLCVRQVKIESDNKRWTIFRMIGGPNLTKYCFVRKRKTKQGKEQLGVTKRCMECLLDHDELSEWNEIVETIAEVTGAMPLSTPKWLTGWEKGDFYNGPFYIKPIPLSSKKVLGFRKWTIEEMTCFMKDEIISMMDDVLPEKFKNEKWSFKKTKNDDRFLIENEIEVSKTVDCKTGEIVKLTLMNTSCFQKTLWIHGFYCPTNCMYSFISFIDEDDFKKKTKRIMKELRLWAQSL